MPVHNLSFAKRCHDVSFPLIQNALFKNVGNVFLLQSPEFASRLRLLFPKAEAQQYFYLASQFLHLPPQQSLYTLPLSLASNYHWSRRLLLELSFRDHTAFFADSMQDDRQSLRHRAPEHAAYVHNI